MKNDWKCPPIKRIMCVADCFCPEPSQRDRWSSSQRFSVPDDDDHEFNVENDDNDDNDDDEEINAENDDNGGNDEDEVDVGHDGDKYQTWW